MLTHIGNNSGSAGCVGGYSIFRNGREEIVANTKRQEDNAKQAKHKTKRKAKTKACGFGTNGYPDSGNH
jgi:hypothetical protein